MKSITLTKRELVLQYTFMVIGCICYALSLNLFIIPNHIVSGGVSGASTLISYLTNWNVGTMTILINIPILLAGFKLEGLRFILNCLLTTTMLGVITDLTAFLPGLTLDPLLGSLYGGLAQGLGIGCFVKYMVSSGGTELLGRIFHAKWEAISIPVFIAVLDASVVILGAVVLKNPENVLYALIIIAVSTAVSNVIVVGLNAAKLCYIITDFDKELAKLLVESSPRGVTLLEGVGAYTGNRRGVLLTCVKNNQLTQLRALVKQIDPNAFVIVSNATEVRGKGFLGI